MLHSKCLHTVALGALAVSLSTAAVHGQDRSRYRAFQLGSSLASVATLSGAEASAASTIHERPVLMQDLQWRTPYFVSGSTFTSGSLPLQADSIQTILFSFYDDQLFRIVVDYDRQRTEGMTDADMIEAISAVYGAASQPPTIKGRAAQRELDFVRSVAEWIDPDYSVRLYRSSYGSGFRLTVTSRRLDGLAQAAAAQAVRLDA